MSIGSFGSASSSSFGVAVIVTVLAVCQFEVLKVNVVLSVVNPVPGVMVTVVALSGWLASLTPYSLSVLPPSTSSDVMGSPAVSTSTIPGSGRDNATL